MKAEKKWPRDAKFCVARPFQSLFHSGIDLRGGDRSDFVESLREVVDQVVNVFGSDRESDCAGIDVLLGKFLFVELGMGCGGGMNHEALDVGYVGQEREDLERVDEALSGRAASGKFDSENRACALGKVTVI